jgi:hypothetical protein
MLEAGIQQEYLRRRQAALFCGMSISFLEKAERLGTGPKMSRLGKSPIYKVENLRNWIASRATHDEVNDKQAA